MVTVVQHVELKRLGMSKVQVAQLILENKFVTAACKKLACYRYKEGWCMEGWYIGQMSKETERLNMNKSLVNQTAQSSCRASA